MRYQEKVNWIQWNWTEAQRVRNKFNDLRMCRLQLHIDYHRRQWLPYSSRPKFLFPLITTKYDHYYSIYSSACRNDFIPRRMYSIRFD